MVGVLGIIFLVHQLVISDFTCHAFQVLWLLPAYLLDFQGYNTFLWIYLAGLAFFLINVFVVVKVLRKQVFTPTFTRGRLAMVDKNVSKLK